MSRRIQLAEAQQLLLEQYVEECLPGRLDYRTGEILDSRRYEVLPYQTDRSAPSPIFAECRSHAALSRFLDGIDRRTLSRVNDCRRLYDIDKGNHHLWDRKAIFTSPQLISLDRLVNRLDYANAIITTPAQLASDLSLNTKNLYRYLQSLGPLVRVYGARDGMARGSLKVLVSPAYGFRYPKADLPQARTSALASWYRTALLQ